MTDKKEGFRIGNYFVTFPDDEFVKEDENGNMYILADIYKIDDNKNVIRLKEEEITPEIESLINDEISRLLMDGIKHLDK